MCIRCWSVVMILISSAVASAQPALPRIGSDPARDLRLTMQARKLLYDEPDLAPLNVGVIVNDRVAVLWGPVPTVEAMFRAELALRRMSELVEIRNKLFLSETLEPIRTPLKIETSPQYLPDPMPPPKLPAEPRPIFGAPGILTGQAKIEAKKPALPPVALGLPHVDDGDLTAAIRTFLQSKTTFRSVEFTLKDRRVYLKAADQDTDALHEAARGISRLPSVEGVILLDKSSPR